MFRTVVWVSPTVSFTHSTGCGCWMSHGPNTSCAGAGDAPASGIDRAATATATFRERRMGTSGERLACPLQRPSPAELARRCPGGGRSAALGARLRAPLGGALAAPLRLLRLRLGLLLRHL